jgi:molybdopterin converting factor small subunit
MNIQVRLGAGISKTSGVSRLSLTLDQGASVGDLQKILLDQYPAFQIKTAVTVIDGEHVSLVTPLADGQEVAFLLPIAGG